MNRANFRPNQPLIEFLGIPGLDESMTTTEEVTTTSTLQFQLDLACSYIATIEGWRDKKTEDVVEWLERSLRP